MKYVLLSLAHDPATRHPMHQFLVDHEGFARSTLLSTSDTAAGRRSALFHVEGGPVADYVEAVDATESVIEYEVSPCPDDSFYLYVRDELSPAGRRLVESFSRVGLVTVGPVTYESDGTTSLTLVGPAETVQRALAEVPEGITPDVRAVGEYRHRGLDGGASLTDRQYEAVAAAVDCGYYREPRSGSVADVGERLGCAPGTAAEHLRRAEAAIMRGVVDDGGPKSLSTGPANADP